MKRSTIAAIDIGSSSVRVARVGFDSAHLSLEIVHRIRHQPVVKNGILRWDMALLRSGVEAGLSALQASDEHIVSVGVDSFGVDYVLLDADGEIVTQPSNHRDSRNVRAMGAVIKKVGATSLYEATGTQIMPINSIFSLLADLSDRPKTLARAEKFLMMPDYVHHLLCGSTGTEYTSASTTGALDLRSGEWDRGLLGRLGLPARLFPEVIPTGTDVGPLKGYSGALEQTRVVLPAAHDTASAVVAAPLRYPDSVFISSGTWSLVGVEVDRPIITAASLRANLTNEGGYGGKVRLLKNLIGLWILQECQRDWSERGARYSYAEIAKLASDAPGLQSVIHTSSLAFLQPGDMPRRVQEYCARFGEPVPVSVGEIARCAIDSLALSYRTTVQEIAEVTGSQAPELNIVGGGAAHDLLSQLTSDAVGLPVISGPEEATALGNAGVQLASIGELRGSSDIRAAVTASTQLRHFDPRNTFDWAAAAARIQRQIDLDSLGQPELPRIVAAASKKNQ